MKSSGFCWIISKIAIIDLTNNLAGTPRLFDDTKKGIPSYEALNDRIEDKVDSEYRDLRKPIIVLQGFTDDELVDISKNIISLHEDVYDWNGQELVYPVLDDIVEHYQQNASLTGGRVTPRLFVRTIIYCIWWIYVSM